MTSVTACIVEVLKRGLDDWIDAAEVAWVVQSTGKQGTTADVRRVALEVIAALVRGGLMTTGDVTREGFSEWRTTPDEAIARIAREWQAGKSPGLGEICWLSNTNEGDRRAESGDLSL